jgi:hypothetical protein
MGMKKMLMVAVALVATVTAANADLLGFKTPSGNIHCQLDDFGSSTYLRCDILKMESRVPPRPRDCDLDWGQSFSVTRHRAQRICHGDTVMDEDLPTPLTARRGWAQDSPASQNQVALPVLTRLDTGSIFRALSRESFNFTK